MGSLKLTSGKLIMVCLGILGVAFIAVTVFNVSIGNLLFFAFILACPLLHIFMMKGHGGPASPASPNRGEPDGGQGGHGQKSKEDDKKGKSCH